MLSLCLSSAEILQANDSLTQVINLYRQLVKGEEVNGDTSSTARLPGTALMPSLSSVKSRDIENLFCGFWLMRISCVIEFPLISM